MSLSSVPLWVGPLLHAASRLKTDRERRRKVYRLIQRQLVSVGLCYIINTSYWLNVTQSSHIFKQKNKIGSSTCGKRTYVYPAKLKEMIRSAFPDDICNYPDPCHENVRCTRGHVVLSVYFQSNLTLPVCFRLSSSLWMI